MEKQERTDTRRQYLEIEAIEPETGKTYTVQISYNRLHNVAERGLGEIECVRYTVPYILQHPTAIFEGLCYESDESARGYGWRCYCGIPQNDYTIEGQKVETRQNRVFLVFLNDEKVAYNWVWVKCDEFDSNLPINHSNRFKKRLL